MINFFLVHDGVDGLYIMMAISLKMMDSGFALRWFGNCQNIPQVEVLLVISYLVGKQKTPTPNQQKHDDFGPNWWSNLLS